MCFKGTFPLENRAGSCLNSAVVFLTLKKMKKKLKIAWNLLLVEEVGNRAELCHAASWIRLFHDLLRQAGWLEEEVAMCVSPFRLYLTKLLVVLHMD